MPCSCCATGSGCDGYIVLFNLSAVLFVEQGQVVISRVAKAGRTFAEFHPLAAALC